MFFMYYSIDEIEFMVIMCILVCIYVVYVDVRLRKGCIELSMKV